MHAVDVDEVRMLLTQPVMPLSSPRIGHLEPVDTLAHTSPSPVSCGLLEHTSGVIALWGPIVHAQFIISRNWSSKGKGRGKQGFLEET